MFSLSFLVFGTWKGKKSIFVGFEQSKWWGRRDTVSSRGYKRKRTSGTEAVMAEAMSVPEHLKKWRKIIGSGKRWRCHFWAVYNPRSEKDTGSEEKKL